MTSGVILVAVCALLTNDATASRILAFFPFGGQSHHHVFRPILYELADRGHQINYVTAVPLPRSHPNITVAEVDNLVVAAMKQYGASITKKKSLIEQVIFLNMVGYSSAKNQLPNKNIQSLIHSNEKYDLVLHEAFFIQEYAVAFQHKFNAPGVAIHPFGDYAWLNENSGLPDNPSYMIDSKMIASDRLSFLERIEATWACWASVAVSYYTLYKLQGLVDEHFTYPGWESRPSLFQLLSDQALILSNSHHSVGYAYPKAPHVKEIGGVNVSPAKPLPLDLKKFMDEATDGVIYFSLGSNINMTQMVSLSFRETFSNHFGRIKQKVLWKYDGEPWPNMPKNIMLGKWFPQQSILGHTNLKFFVTHGGVLSSFEAVSFGVPQIVIPFFGDQYKNARRASSAGFGVELYLDNITAESVAWATGELLQNPRYKAEAVRRAALFHDRPMKPVEEAVYWIEYVLRHGRVLQPAGARLSFIQLHLLDVYAFITVLVLAAIWSIKKLIALVLSKIVGPKRTQKMQKADKKKKQKKV